MKAPTPQGRALLGRDGRSRTSPGSASERWFARKESSLTAAGTGFHATARSPFFFFQAEDGIRDYKVTGQTCALPISCPSREPRRRDASPLQPVPGRRPGAGRLLLAASGAA